LVVDALLGASVFTAKHKDEIEKQIKQMKNILFMSGSQKSLSYMNSAAKLDADSAFERIWT